MVRKWLKNLGGKVAKPSRDHPNGGSGTVVVAGHIFNSNGDLAHAIEQTCLSGGSQIGLEHALWQIVKFNHSQICAALRRPVTEDPVDVARVKAVLDRPRVELPETKDWKEVTTCNNEVLCLREPLPDVYVVRGSQMFKLKWPDLPVETKSFKG